MINGCKKILHKVGYAILSLWLLFHVFAVFIAPAAMPPSSPLLENGYQIALPYNESLYLNHGYHFFAPDPGASTLIAWEIPRDGDVPVVGRFPEVSIRPRLLYHRYFMLAENVWAFDEETQQDMVKAYAQHVAGQFRSDRISISRMRHEPSSIVRLQAGGRLDDPETFQKDLLWDFDFSAEPDKPDSSLAQSF